MKILDIKKAVFEMVGTKDTRRLKKERPDLTDGKDLRYKEQWLIILKLVQYLRSHGLDISIEDIEKSEQMLKKSLFNVGAMAGIGEEELYADWQRIKLESQFLDIHIEEL